MHGWRRGGAEQVSSVESCAAEEGEGEDESEGKEEDEDDVKKNDKKMWKSKVFFTFKNAC